MNGIRPDTMKLLASLAASKDAPVRADMSFGPPADIYAKQMTDLIQGNDAGSNQITADAQSYSDMPVNADLKEPGGPASWALREQDDFIAAINKRTGEVKKLVDAPLTSAEKKEVLAPHGAGPIQSSDMELNPGYGFDPSTGGVNVNANTMQENAALRNQTHSGPGSPFSPQYGDMNLMKDLGGLMTTLGPRGRAAQYSDMPVMGNVGAVSPDMIAQLQGQGWLPGAPAAPPVTVDPNAAVITSDNAAPVAQPGANPPPAVAAPGPFEPGGGIIPAPAVTLPYTPGPVPKYQTTPAPQMGPAPVPPMTAPSRWANAFPEPGPQPQVSYGGTKAPAQSVDLLPKATGGAGTPAGWQPSTRETERKEVELTPDQKKELIDTKGKQKLGQELEEAGKKTEIEQAPLIARAEQLETQLHNFKVENGTLVPPTNHEVQVLADNYKLVHPEWSEQDRLQLARDTLGKSYKGGTEQLERDKQAAAADEKAKRDYAFAQADLARSKGVDPNKMYHDKSIGGKIMTTLSLVIGGLTGSRDALDRFYKDRDIDIQNQVRHIEGAEKGALEADNHYNQFLKNGMEKDQAIAAAKVLSDKQFNDQMQAQYQATFSPMGKIQLAKMMQDHAQQTQKDLLEEVKATAPVITKKATEKYQKAVAAGQAGATRKQVADLAEKLLLQGKADSVEAAQRMAGSLLGYNPAGAGPVPKPVMKGSTGKTNPLAAVGETVGGTAPTVPTTLGSTHLGWVTNPSMRSPAENAAAAQIQQAADIYAKSLNRRLSPGPKGEAEARVILYGTAFPDQEEVTEGFSKYNRAIGGLKGAATPGAAEAPETEP